MKARLMIQPALSLMALLATTGSDLCGGRLFSGFWCFCINRTIRALGIREQVIQFANTVYIPKAGSFQR
jgi:hypothetical protein